jgi:hypothetical protein
MGPQLTGFALGLLLGAAKVMAIAAVGFGIAWWRARLRVKSLEAELLEAQEMLDARSLRAPGTGAELPPQDAPRLPEPHRRS